MAGNFKDLIVWQKAISLAEQIYDATESFPQTRALRPDKSGSKSGNIRSE
jgi:hypothetical protein